MNRARELLTSVVNRAIAKGEPVIACLPAQHVIDLETIDRAIEMCERRSSEPLFGRHLLGNLRKAREMT